MTCATAAAATPSRAMPRRITLSDRSAFWLLASISVALLAGSSAPTPLYPRYQALWGFSAITTTLVFGVYAIAVLLALLVAGRLSNHIGRRPVLVATTLASAVAMAVLGTATGEVALYIGRTLQGLATGAAVAAVGAGLLDLDKVRGTVANALAPISGTAVGALLAGLVVHFLPYPTHTIYALMGCLFVLQGVGALFMAEATAPTPGALASLRPRFAVPDHIKGPMLTAVPVLIAAWSVAGFSASLGPALIRNLFGLDASLFGGIALFVMAASGSVAVLLLMQREARTILALGASALAIGSALVWTALSLGSVELFFVGTALAGMGFGAGFQGAMRTVLPLATPAQRAGVLSVVFVVSYLAMALPCVVAGIAVANGVGIVRTAEAFSACVLMLAIVAVLATVKRRQT
ncbi:MAG: transporter [Rhizobacter sp.]|nr:transporter [Rhizobacter sp.]